MTPRVRPACPPAVIAIALLAALAVSSCSKNATPPTTAAASVNNGTAPPADGAPQIVMSPDNVHIEYHVYGTGDPAVVLIHGWSCDSNYWQAQIDALKSRFTTVTVDLAGHGASGRNRTDWTMENYGEDVASV